MNAEERTYLQNLISLYNSWTVVMDSDFQRTRSAGARDALANLADHCNVEYEKDW